VSESFSRTRGTDRRGAPRFEIVGSLTGTLLATGTLAVRDLSCGGALVQSPRPFSLNSVHLLQLEGVDRTVKVEARVVRSSWHGGADYAVAFDFLNPEPAVVDAIQQILRWEIEGV
jgi:hypothetical protein